MTVHDPKEIADRPAPGFSEAEIGRVVDGAVTTFLARYGARPD